MNNERYTVTVTENTCFRNHSSQQTVNKSLHYPVKWLVLERIFIFFCSNLSRYPFIYFLNFPVI